MKCSKLKLSHLCSCWNMRSRSKVTQNMVKGHSPETEKNCSILNMIVSFMQCSQKVLECLGARKSASQQWTALKICLPLLLSLTHTKKANNKEVIKVQQYWPFVQGIHSWIPCTKGQYCLTLFYTITSSWCNIVPIIMGAHCTIYH